MNGVRSFSQGVDTLLMQVQPRGARPETTFPQGLHDSDTRRGADETLHQLFVRLVNQYCVGDPNLVAIEENIAVFATFKWRIGRLHYASISTIVAENTLEDLYLDDTARAQYLRLDLN